MLIFRGDDHAGFVIRASRDPYIKVPKHLNHYRGMTVSFRVERILARIAKSKHYLFPDEAMDLWHSIAQKYAYSTSMLNVHKSRTGMLHCGYAKLGQSWMLAKIHNCYGMFLKILDEAQKTRRRDKNMETTGELRKTLAKCLIDAMEGRLTGDAMRGVIGCANQINTSLAVEIKARAQLAREGVASGAMGDMKLDK